MTAIVGAFELGMLFAIMSLGVFISFRVLNIPDLTIDGSFTTGCAVSAIFSSMNMSAIGLVLAIIAGSLAGMITGFLQTKGKIQPILAGILTMTGLYSINLRIMGSKPTLFLESTLFTQFKQFFKLPYSDLILIVICLLLIVVFLLYFFQTQLGMALRATGDNEAMVRASSIHADMMKVCGLAFANALVAFAGGLFAQYQGFSDINGGVGMMVIGLASVIVGEVFFRSSKMKYRIASVLIGAILYRLILTGALQLGIQANDLKLLSAILVVLAISFPQLRRKHHA